MQGRTAAFLEAARQDLATFRRLGAQAEAWAAGHHLMLAEDDQGDVAAALAVGRELLAEIRAAGRLRSNAQLLAMHTAMLADAGKLAETRAALADALPMLGTQQSTELTLLALAWLAAHEGRPEDAARVLGWFESPQRNGGRYGPLTFTSRSVARLGARLAERLGSDALAALQLAARAGGDARAVAWGLGSATGAGPPPAARTDAKPTEA
jgi:hypothetical protein